MDQNCISTHLLSRERGGRGPKIIPRVSQMTNPDFLIESNVLKQEDDNVTKNKYVSQVMKIRL